MSPHAMHRAAGAGDVGFPRDPNELAPMRPRHRPLRQQSGSEWGTLAEAIGY